MKEVLYEYAYREGTTLVWRNIKATDEKDAINKIRTQHKNISSFFPYAGPLLVKEL